MSEFKQAVAVGCFVVCVYAAIGASLLAGATWIVKSVMGW